MNWHTCGEQQAGHADLVAKGDALERYGQQRRGPTREQHHQTPRRRHLGGAPQGLVPRGEAAAIGQRMPAGVIRDRRRHQRARTRPDGNAPFDGTDQRSQAPPQHPFGRLAGGDEAHRSPGDEMAHHRILERGLHQS